MHLHRVKAENFRVFGDIASERALDVVLNVGLNVLVGENDAGKTAIVDAIRYGLLTTSYEFLRVLETDFHVSGTTRADSLTIELEIKGLSIAQQGTLAEWLTYGSGEPPYLVIHVRARRVLDSVMRRTRIELRYFSGHDGSGPEIGGAVRDLIRATYLRPLRDAEGELRPGKSSRLSQVLKAHPDIKGEETSDFDTSDPTKVPTTLVGFMAQAQHHIGKSEVIKSVQNDINDDYLRHLSFDTDPLGSRIGVASEITLQQILERLELALLAPPGVDPAAACGRGLGYNNVLFMATELLLLGDGEELPLLLIEEPEAHLHPQLQARVLELLLKQADDEKHPVQVLLSTHSPNLASTAPIESLILVVRGRAHRLAKGETMLEPGDYEFLRRFLDVTKANLFFARAVAIVEGPAEALLLPALAEACGRSFSRAGVSVVTVGSVGLFRYARILQRKDFTRLPIPVACITDRDIVPDHVTYVESGTGRKRRKFSDFGSAEREDKLRVRKARAEGGSTKVFVSDIWTLEYDLAAFGLPQLIFDATAMTTIAEDRGDALSEAEFKAALIDIDAAWRVKLAEGRNAEDLASCLYAALHAGMSKAVTAQYAAELVRRGRYGSGDVLWKALPPYLREAIEYLVLAVST